MIICNKCGAENDDSRFICHDCGRELIKDECRSIDDFETTENILSSLPKKIHTSRTGGSNDVQITVDDQNGPYAPSAQYNTPNGESAFCEDCNVYYDRNTRFCKRCGKDLSTTFNETYACPYCSAENYENASFCVKCGRNLYDNNSEFAGPEDFVVRKSDREKKILIGVLIAVFIFIVITLFSSFSFMRKLIDKKEFEKFRYKETKDLNIAYENSSFEDYFIS